MKKLALLVSGFTLALLGPSSMFADTLFNFNFSALYPHGEPGYMFSGAGQFDTVATSTPGTFQVVGVSGTTATIYQPVAIAGIGAGGDNLITVNSGVASVDTIGFGYVLTDSVSVVFRFQPANNLNFPTGTIVSLSGDGGPGQGIVSEFAATDLYVTPASPTTAATPEPGSFLLLATGALGLLGRATALRLRPQRTN